MAHENAQVSVVVIKDWFGESEPVDRCPMNGGQIMIIGLVTRVGWLAKLFGGERVNDASLKARLTERATRSCRVRRANGQLPRVPQTRLCSRMA